jgi:hypothetical protein
LEIAVNIKQQRKIPPHLRRLRNLPLLNRKLLITMGLMRRMLMKGATMSTNTMRMRMTRAKTMTNTTIKRNITGSHRDRKKNCTEISRLKSMRLVIGKVTK